MQTDWIDTPKIDPRMPTDPEYVEAGSLAEKYGIGTSTMKELISDPAIRKTAGGNPWTEGGRELIFLHEPTVQNRLSKTD